MKGGAEIKEDTAKAVKNKAIELKKQGSKPACPERE
jgi:hypothetical protein